MDLKLQLFDSFALLLKNKRKTNTYDRDTCVAYCRAGELLMQIDRIAIDVFLICFLLFVVIFSKI